MCLLNPLSYYARVFCSTYEEYLGAPFPFGCYKQVFVDSESILFAPSFGASMVTLSSHLLVDERIIDQVKADCTRIIAKSV